MKVDLQAIKGATTAMTAKPSSSAIVTSSKHDSIKHSNIIISDNGNDGDDHDNNHYRKDLNIYPFVHDLKSVNSIVKEIVIALSKGSNGKQYRINDSLHIVKLLQMVR
jgi:hypothetical protein